MSLWRTNRIPCRHSRSDPSRGSGDCSGHEGSSGSISARKSSPRSTVRYSHPHEQRIGTPGASRHAPARSGYELEEADNFLQAAASSHVHGRDSRTRARCVSGRSDTTRHEEDRGRSRMALTWQNSTTRQTRALPGKDAIPLLKRVPQVRILPGAQRVTALTWGLPRKRALLGLGLLVRGRLRERTRRRRAVTQFRTVSGLIPRSVTTDLIVASGHDSYHATASALNSGERFFMTTRCPSSDPQDPVSRVSDIRGQSPSPFQATGPLPRTTLACLRMSDRPPCT